jgi:phage protein D
MRGHKTKTFAQASPLDCAQQIASAAGLTPKTKGGQPAPVKTFRMQSNESDFHFLRRLADLEGYLFYVEGSELHFERPTVSSREDFTVTYGQDLKTFLPVANFRRPVVEVEVAAWDSGGKSTIKGTAKPGDELWSVAGDKPGANLAKFQQTKPKLAIAEGQVTSKDHADTVAKAAATMRNLEFLTAEVEVQGDPDIRPGALVKIDKVGVYSGRYLVTEANHFYDAAGYQCVFYVARDKWGDSAAAPEQKPQAKPAAQPRPAPRGDDAQAQVMRDAARDGTPFCEECEKVSGEPSSAA